MKFKKKMRNKKHNKEFVTKVIAIVRLRQAISKIVMLRNANQIRSNQPSGKAIENTGKQNTESFCGIKCHRRKSKLMPDYLFVTRKMAKAKKTIKRDVLACSSESEIKYKSVHSCTTEILIDDSDKEGPCQIGLQILPSNRYFNNF